MKNSFNPEQLRVSYWCVYSNVKPRIGHCKHCAYYTLEFIERDLKRLCLLTGKQESNRSPIMKPHCDKSHHVKALCTSYPHFKDLMESL